MFMDAPPETGNDLLDRAIDYHGLELIDAIQRSKTQSFLGASSFLFAGDPENDLRKKVHHFIAKNTRALFQEKPSCSQMVNTNVTSEDDYYAAMPPLETFMGLDTDVRRKHLSGYLEKGDIVIGRVIKLKPGQGFFVSFLCLDHGKKRDLVDLGIRGFCPQNCIPPNRDGIGVQEVFADDYIRGVVLSVGESDGDVITISMLSSDLPENVKTHVGPVDRDDLPAYYRMIGLVPSKNYDTFLHQIATSSNPRCVRNLMKKFDLNDDIPTTFIKSAQTRVIPKNEYADELRKTQSHRWSLKSVKQGVDQFKKAKFTEAMQHFNRALEIDGQNAEALVARGALFANNNNYPKAIEDFERALEINSHHVNAKNYMCQTLVAHGRNLQESRKFDEAMVQYQKVISVNPGYRDAENCIRALQLMRGGTEGEVSKAVDLLLTDSKRKAEELKKKASDDPLGRRTPLSPTRKDIFGTAPARPPTPDDFEQAISHEEECKMAETFIRTHNVFRDYPELEDLGMETMLRVLPRIYAALWTNSLEQYKRAKMVEEKAKEERQRLDGITSREDERRSEQRERERRRIEEEEKKREDRDRMDSVDRELYGDSDKDEKKPRSDEIRKSRVDDELYSGMMDRELNLSANRRSIDETSRDRREPSRDRRDTSRDRRDVSRDRRDTSRDRRDPSRDRRDTSRDRRDPSRDRRDMSRDRRDVSRDRRDPSRDRREYSRDRREESRDRKEPSRECRLVSPERRVSMSKSDPRYSSRDELINDVISHSKKENISKEKNKTSSRDRESRSKRKSESRSRSRSPKRSSERHGRSRDRKRKYSRSRSRSISRSLNSKEREAELKYLERLKYLDESIEKRKRELEELKRDKPDEEDGQNGSRSKDRNDDKQTKSKDEKSSKSYDLSRRSRSKDKHRSRSRSDEESVRVITASKKRRSSTSSSSSSRSRSRSRGRDRRRSSDRHGRSRSRDRYRSRSRSTGRTSSRDHKSSRDKRSSSKSKNRKSRSRSREVRIQDSTKKSIREVKVKPISDSKIAAIPLPILTEHIVGIKKSGILVNNKLAEIPLPRPSQPEPYSSSATRTLYSDLESSKESRTVTSKTDSRSSKNDKDSRRDSGRSRSDEKSRDKSSDKKKIVKSKWDSPERDSRWDADKKSKKRRFQEDAQKPGSVLPSTHKLDVFGDYPSKSSNPLAPPVAKRPNPVESNGVRGPAPSGNVFVPRQLVNPNPPPGSNRFSFNVKSVRQVQKTKMDEKQTLVGKVSVQSAPDVEGPSSKGSDSLSQMESFLANLKKMKGTAELKHISK